MMMCGGRGARRYSLNEVWAKWSVRGAIVKIAQQTTNCWEVLVGGS